MNITIIGWYGTETLGDRAILVGIVTVLSKIYNEIKIKLGSIFPFFSERTILEDSDFIKKITRKNINIEIFDSKIATQLNKAIKQSEIVVMGGGPLMHIDEMYMIDYAFIRAKKLKKKTVIFGCGIGPIYIKKYQKTLISILKNSDISFLRDYQSLKYLNEITNNSNVLSRKKISVYHDPAVIPCLYCKENLEPEQENYIAVNLRKFPKQYSTSNIHIDNHIIKFLEHITNNFNKKIKMIPMHYFAGGGDDRDYFYELLFKLNDKSSFEVQNIPMNLEQTMQTFAEASLNIGMRYHSVLFQTIMNGNNYIIDYTEQGSGKISGFLNMLDSKDFYRNRYINLHNNQNIDFKYSDKKFELELRLENILRNSYSELE